tara:strand:+ start:6044 stop:6217 length:174 start_codon:yes stop_codon:yes gene_type:complete
MEDYYAVDHIAYETFCEICETESYLNLNEGETELPMYCPMCGEQTNYEEVEDEDRYE